MTMTFEQFVESLGIDPKRIYTYGEVATIMEKEPSTIRAWCNLGMRTRRHGIVSLEKFKRGRETAIHGRCLIEFLRKTQADN